VESRHAQNMSSHASAADAVLGGFKPRLAGLATGPRETFTRS
jgi:hypothetical protein